jgi:dTDP-4-amino-4,6-dideoxygalactose transaminase
MATMRVPFGDLRRQNQALREAIDATIARVLDSGWYILGEEVRAFEAEFAAYCGSAHCVGVASGFEALYLALAALQVGPGDEVITVANACMYEVAPIMQLGATPVLVDVDPVTGTMEAAAFAAAISPRTKAVLPVHLFGRLAPMQAICAIAARHGIAVVEDAAQAHGAWAYDAEGRARKAGQWGAAACFSFYPTKNLGALGDAGAIVTADSALAERLRNLRMYGWSEKYVAVAPGGRNSRLDELQAAVLRVKLRHLDAGNAARRERAAWYRARLGGLPLALPADEPGHVYHLFVLTLPDRAVRDRLRERLRAAGIGSDIHYPLPTHLQPAYAGLGYGEGALPVSEELAGRILSLPLFPELTQDEVAQVAAAVATGVAA